MIITIEGGIGAGKSTLLEMCKDLKLRVPHVVIFESVSDWTSLKDSKNQSIFDLFYQDKKRFAYVFQTYVLFSRVETLLDEISKTPGKILICERSFMTDFEIFGKTLYESGDITEIEWSVYVRWHSIVRRLFNKPISGQIYIRTTPEVCHERIEKRNRQSENLIDMEYLDNLHKKHEEWLLNPDYNDIPTLVIDGNKDTSEMVDDLANIETFINKLHSTFSA